MHNANYIKICKVKISIYKCLNYNKLNQKMPTA